MAQMSRRKKRKLRNLLLNVLWWAALGCFLVSASVLLVYQWRSGTEKKKMETIAQPMQLALHAQEQGDGEAVAETALRLAMPQEFRRPTWSSPAATS